jgi:hypothetical protein
MFFKTPVEVSYMRNAVNNNFAVDDDFEPQDAMRGRMLRTHINNHFFRTNCSAG